MRLVWLDTVAGINGDECLFGIRVYQWVHGEPVSWRAFPGGRLETSPILFCANVIPGLLRDTAFFYLRLPTVVASILTLWLVGRGWKSVIGPAACSALVLLLAVSPQQIVYARIGFDPSLVPFCQALLIAAVMSGRAWWIAAATLLGVSTYLVVWLSLPLAGLLWLWKHYPHRVRAAGAVAIVGSWAAVALRYVLPLQGLGGPERVDFRRFCSGLTDVFTGEAAFAYVVDPARAQLDGPLATLCGLTLILALTVQGWRDLSRRPELGCLAAGTLIIAAGLFLRLGTHAVVPPQDRNASSLVLPVLAWIVAQLFCSPIVRRPRLLWGMLIGVSALLSYRTLDRYLLALRYQGSSSHRAFMSAPIEPREAAYNQARAWLQPGAVIIAEDWWIFQPVTYLALPARIAVVHPSNVSDLKQAVAAGCVVVAHSYSPLHDAVVKLGLPLRHATVRQAGGREVLEVLAVGR